MPRKKKPQCKRGAPVLVYLDPDLRYECKAACVNLGVTWQEFFNHILRDFVRRYDRQTRLGGPNRISSDSEESTDGN